MESTRVRPSRDFDRLEALYAQVEEAAGIGVWDWNAAGDRVTWTDGLYRILGVEPKSFEPTFDAYLRALHPDDRGRAREELVRSARDNTPFSHEVRVVRPDGSVRHLRGWGRPARDAAGKPAGLVGVCQDVTEVVVAREASVSLERKLEERLESHAAELAFKSAVLTAQQEASLDGIFIADSAGRSLSRNRRFGEMWGIPEEVLARGSLQAVLEATLEKVVDPEDRLARSHWLAQHPMEKSFETLRLRDGRTFERYSSPVIDGEKLLGRVWYTRDISTRANAETAAKENAEMLARSNADLEMYAGAAAHDLSAPLRKVASFAGLLERRCRGKLDAEDRKLLSCITESARRMSELVQAALELSKAAAQQKDTSDVDLGPLVKEVRADLEPHIKEAAAEITVGPLPAVRANGALVGRLFQNLLANAVLYRAEGRAPKIEIGSRPLPDGGVEVFVQDNGIGFKTSQAKEIFEPFRRLHTYEEYKGNGIGLAVCERVARRYGWRLSASGQPGRGARFTLAVPAASVVRRP